jgi:iron complex transport system permease protein
MLQQLSIWFTGSFTGIVRGRYELLYLVLIVLVLIFIVADRFTVAGLGKDIATNVGLNYGRVQLLGIGMVAVVTGIVTVVVGSLPFLGLIVPNIISMFRGDNLRSNLPWVVMLGMWILILADIFARTVIAPFEVPVSLILGILGAVVFVFLLVRGRRHAN